MVLQEWKDNDWGHNSLFPQIGHRGNGLSENETYTLLEMSNEVYW
jgi:hypothetical protein